MLKPDPFSKNNAAQTLQPFSQFEDKIYSIIDNKTFIEQLRTEQNPDLVIHRAK